MRTKAALIVALAFLDACGIESETSLRLDFAENREAYHEILAMFQQDAHLVRVADGFTRLENDWSWPREEVGLSEERWDRYRELFKRADLEGGIERQGGYIFFYMSGVGLGISGRTRGVAYAISEPNEVAADLDSRSGEGISYVLVDRNWYLFDWAH